MVIKFIYHIFEHAEAMRLYILTQFSIMFYMLKHFKDLEPPETYSETITASPCPSGMIA